MPAPAPAAIELPLYANEQINTYRRAAPAAIGLRGFLQANAVYQQRREAAGAWLDTHLTGAGKVLDIAQVQLYLTELVQDSPTRNHSLARLRRARAGFRARSFDLKHLRPRQRCRQTAGQAGRVASMRGITFPACPTTSSPRTSTRRLLDQSVAACI
ncbi:MAG: hypothetical protein SV966_03150 [Actinomycetota bacterium]|nr:hypothetical protein [Actinomycetota bacterium]